jgi:hypothetical protein
VNLKEIIFTSPEQPQPQHHFIRRGCSLPRYSTIYLSSDKRLI